MGNGPLKLFESFKIIPAWIQHCHKLVTITLVQLEDLPRLGWCRCPAHRWRTLHVTAPLKNGRSHGLWWGEAYKIRNIRIKNDNWTLYHLSILGLNVQQIWMFIAMPGRASMRNTARSAMWSAPCIERNCLFQTNAWSQSRLQIHKVHGARHLSIVLKHQDAMTV